MGSSPSVARAYNGAMRLASGFALIVALSAGDIERAQQIARGTEAERGRFHRQYIVQVGDPTVTRIEIITPFRRAVLVTEDHVRQGDWMLARSVRAVEESLRPTAGLPTITAQ